MAMRPLDRLPSIRAKLGSVIVFAVAVTVLIMYATVGFALHRYQNDRQYRELALDARLVAAAAFDTSGLPSANLKRVVAKVGAPVVVVDPYGRPLISKHLAVPPTVERALAGAPVDTGEAGGLQYYGIPVTRQGQVVGVVYVARRADGGGLAGAVIDTLALLHSVWWQLLLAGAVSGAIALGLSRVLARGMTQPLRDMAHAAQRLARGDYAERVPVQSRDEVGRLAESFNTMARDLGNLERLRRDLVANVSHELKTPITALRAHLENLMDGVEQPDRTTLAVMLDQADRLGRLVEQLLDLSRLESGLVPLELEPLALAPLVHQVGREIALARPDGMIEFRNEVPGDLPRVLADRERIHQVLFNLLDNAFRFTPAGGSVAVRAERVGDECEVSVEDTGPGIPEEHLPLVFERFYRVDSGRARDAGGTGIGLAIARSVVDAHGGRIWAERAPGGGSAFRFVLPLADVLGPIGGAQAARPSELRVKEGV